MTPLERALFGEYGEEAQHLADQAVRDAVAQVAAMLKHALADGVSTGGLVKTQAFGFPSNGGEFIIPRRPV